MSRQVLEGVQLQGVDEMIVYAITATPVPDAVTQVKVLDESQNSLDVTATVMPSGAASVDEDVITLPALKLLTEKHLYRVEVLYTSGGNTLEPYFYVRAER